MFDAVCEYHDGHSFPSGNSKLPTSCLGGNMKIRYTSTLMASWTYYYALQPSPHIMLQRYGFGILPQFLKVSTELKIVFHTHTCTKTTIQTAVNRAISNSVQLHDCFVSHDKPLSAHETYTPYRCD